MEGAGFHLEDVPEAVRLESSFSPRDPKGLSLELVEKVIDNAQECFQEEGVDKKVLEMLKNIWIGKINEKQRDQGEMDKELERITKGEEEEEEIEEDEDEVVVAQATGGGDSMTGAIPKMRTTMEEIKRRTTKRSWQPTKRQRANLNVDGGNDDSSDEEGEEIEKEPSEEEEDDDDDDDDDTDGDAEKDDEEEEGVEEDPLGSEDDISDEDPADLFDTENVVVCQYDKITRSRNKWKFHLKDGIMNLNGRDYVFQRATGDAEW